MSRDAVIFLETLEEFLQETSCRLTQSLFIPISGKILICWPGKFRLGHMPKTYINRKYASDLVLQ